MALRLHFTIRPIHIAALFVLFVAGFTRFWQLGAIPTGMSWDEAAIGYIGKMVVQTGRDEYYDFAPVAFQSFGDYKVPLAIYLTGISTTLFGLSPFTTRLPFAVAGVATVGVVMWIGQRLTRQPWLGLAAGWMLAILPWHISFTRVAFESGLATFFFALFLASWLQLRERPTRWAWLTAVLASVAALYTYHSAKIVLPLAGLLIVGYELRTQYAYWLRQWRTILLAGVATVVLLMPLLVNSLWGPGLTRAGQTTVLNPADSLTAGLLQIAQQWWQHTQPDFLIMGQTTTWRHSSGYRGILTWTHWLALWIGVVGSVLTLVPTRRSRSAAQQLVARVRAWIVTLLPRLDQPPSVPAMLWIALFLIGLLPAALGFESPHANRALLASIPAVVLMVYGLQYLLEYKQPRPLLLTSAVAALVLVMTLEWGTWWQGYTTRYPVLSSQDWMEGYVPAARAAQLYANQGKNVLMTNVYGQPEIFYAFANDVPFETYRTRQFGSVKFGPILPWETSQYDIIITPQVLPLPYEQTITRRDGTAAFYIYATR